MSSPTRQLAAIMFTDIVGYTTMMGQDESKTIELLRRNRSIHLDLIGKYHGNLLKEMGDGMLAQFDTAVDAVLCARDIQSEAISLSGKIRIGIHLGYVTIENNDVFGNGVNIASRLQSVADPGGIFISEDVFKKIQNIHSIQTDRIGNVLLKNVRDPIQTYAISGGYLPKTSRQRIKSLTGSSIIESMAVLPFQNLSSDSDQQYFVDGMQDALITELSQISSLRVISRTSTLRYRNSLKSITEIGKELGVDAIVEATVFRHKETVRIQVQLIKTIASEEHLWANSYDREVKNVLDIYNNVVTDITSQIGAKLTETESKHLAKANEVNPEAYEEYLKGIFYYEKLKADDFALSLEHFLRSTQHDKNFAPAYSGMAGVWLGRVQMGLISREEALPHVYQNIYKSLDLDINIADAYFWRACLSVWMDWDWDKGYKSFSAAIKLNPNFAIARAYFSHLLIILGKEQEAIGQIDQAMELDPFNELVQSLYGMVLNYARQFERAKNVLVNQLQKNHNHPIVLSTLRTVYHNLGEYDKAYEVFRQSYEEEGEDQMEKILVEGYKNGGYGRALSMVAEAKIREQDAIYRTPWQIATLFTRAGDKSRAVEYLNKAYEIKDPNMPYVQVDPIFDILRDEEGYIDLLRKINLLEPTTS